MASHRGRLGGGGGGGGKRLTPSPAAGLQQAGWARYAQKTNFIPGKDAQWFKYKKKEKLGGLGAEIVFMTPASFGSRVHSVFQFLPTPHAH